MAWFRPMGSDSVEYHRETVMGRGDDHPGRALDYYGSRGETPLRWGGNLAGELGLSGEVTPEDYEALFGPGGIRHPATGQQLTRTTVPGFELVIGLHKSVAVLGVIGRADDMHTILDTETSVTMRHLEDQIMERGGRRGRAEVRTPTDGLVYAVTRHGTSREGDPHPHDHILIGNGTLMLDAKGGWKALQSATIRDRVEAATMVGRLHGAAKAIELGYAIAPDQGESGRARRWRIKGIDERPCDQFSKRADEIAEYLEDQSYTSYRTRNIAARATRKHKRHTGVDQLMAQWRQELEQIGWPVERINAALDEARQKATGLAPPMTAAEIDALTAELMDPEGELMRRRKVFTRSTLIAEIAPRLYGHDPAELDQVIDRVIASPEVVPLIATDHAIEQPYTSARVLANEQTIADVVERLIDRPGPELDPVDVQQAIEAKAGEIGRPLTTGQRHAIETICRSGRAAAVVIGIAGSGKTTALDAATSALEDAGYTVIGTATSGQGARTLGREAGIEARTTRSLLYRLDHHQLTLTNNTVVILDEAGMTTDADVARLLLAVEKSGATAVLVGDHRQLSGVGPGGALAATLARHPHVVTTLTENLRQHDPAERAALDQLREGSAEQAINFYDTHGRIHPIPGRVDTLGAMVRAWAADVAAGHDATMVAHRRVNVAALNRIARAHAQATGQLTGPDLQTPGGRTYAVSDPVVLLAPNYEAGLVTSQRGTVTAIHPDAQALTLYTDDGRSVTLSGEGIDSEHLDHGYATTVHRQQGATCDRTHYLADGGGRELAYVALSRARQRSDIYATGDNLPQVLDDITYDWSQDRHQQWITTTHQPGIDTRTHPAPPASPQERIAQLRREIEHLQKQIPPDVTAEVTATVQHLGQLRQDRAALDLGAGPWHSTPEGAAARQLADATSQLHAAHHRLDEARWPWERHRATRELDDARNHYADAHQQWRAVGQPTANQLDKQIAATRRRLDELRRDHRFNQVWHRDHAEIPAAIRDKARQLRDLEAKAGDVTDVRASVDVRPEQPSAEALLDQAVADLADANHRLDEAGLDTAVAPELLADRPPGVDPPEPDRGIGLGL